MVFKITDSFWDAYELFPTSLVTSLPCLREKKCQHAMFLSPFLYVFGEVPRKTTVLLAGNYHSL
jgi:hypothetical protein